MNISKPLLHILIQESGSVNVKSITYNEQAEQWEMEYHNDTPEVFKNFFDLINFMYNEGFY